MGETSAHAKEQKIERIKRLIRIWGVQITQNQLPNCRHFINVFLLLHSLRTVNWPWLFFHRLSLTLSNGFVGSHWCRCDALCNFFLFCCFRSLWSFFFLTFSVCVHFFLVLFAVIKCIALHTLYSMSVMTKCIRFEVTISVMALWLCSRAFNFTSIQRVSVSI